MKVVHLISDISRINYGVWNVALATFPHLYESGHEPEIWFPESDLGIPDEIKKWNHTSLSITDKIFPSSILISHGTWSWATKVGYQAKKAGFPWIAVPHGMLEPWSMKQKWLKKKLYFELFEKARLGHADALIAVGKPEYHNLQKWFPNVHHIPNGIEPVEGSLVHSFIRSSVQQESENRINLSTHRPIDDPTTFLFLSRLHYKKGVLPLVKAWLSSKLNDDERYQLIIAGPDEGERIKIENIIKKGKSKIAPFGMPDGTIRASRFANQNELSAYRLPPTAYRRSPNTNINLTGPVYGADKKKLLLESDFFILPSQSEGFPTSILEAMTHGCIPIFTEGCNFPEAFEAGVGVRIEFDEKNIREKLDDLASWPEEKRVSMASKAKEFVDKNYNWKDIARKQVELFENVLNDTNR